MISFCSRVEFVFAFRFASLSRKNSPFVSIRKFVISAFHRIIFKEPLAHSLWSKREREKDEAEELLYAHTHKQTNERTNEKVIHFYDLRVFLFSLSSRRVARSARDDARRSLSVNSSDDGEAARALSFFPFRAIRRRRTKGNAMMIAKSLDRPRFDFSQSVTVLVLLLSRSRRVCVGFFFLAYFRRVLRCRMRKEERVDAQINWENARLVARLWC